MEPVASLLPGLIQRPAELGRIRLGERTDKGAPRRLTAFRLTSSSKGTLEAAATLYGGKVRAWTGAPDEGMFELYTTVAELDILIPSSFAVVGQSFEFWQGGTCERRCDGELEQISGSPCLCVAEVEARIEKIPAADRPTERARLLGPDRTCDIVTRLRVILPRVPGLGVWRLDTQGYMAATTLPSTVQMLARLTPGAWIPAVLRAAQRSSKVRTSAGKVETHRFVVPEIDLPGVTIGSIVGQQSPAPEQLAPGDARPAPVTARDRVAERRAEIERQESGAGGPAVVTGTTTDQTRGGGTDDEPVSGSSPAVVSTPASLCGSPSPKKEPCELPTGHDGDHRAGVKSWPATKQAPSSTGATEGAESGADPREETAAGVGHAPAADLDHAERATFVDAPSDEVQAGLDLIPSDHQRRTE